MPEIFGWYCPFLLRIHPTERFYQFFRNRLFLGVRVHDVKKVSKGDLASLVLHVGLELGDGGGHAQGPHDDSQLIHGPDVPRPSVQVKTFPELVNVLFLEKPSLMRKKLIKFCLKWFTKTQNLTIIICCRK